MILKAHFNDNTLQDLAPVPQNTRNVRFWVAGLPDREFDLVAVLNRDVFVFTRCLQAGKVFLLPNALFRSWRDVDLFLFPAGEIGMEPAVRRWIVPVIEKE